MATASARKSLARSNKTPHYGGPHLKGDLELEAPMTSLLIHIGEIIAILLFAFLIGFVKGMLLRADFGTHAGMWGKCGTQGWQVILTDTCPLW
jgi:hypothetical protein